MNAQETAVTRESLSYWWAYLLVGLALITTGFFIISTPAESLLTLSLILSIAILFRGFWEIIYSIGNRKKLDTWGRHLVGGIIDFAIGCYLILNPQVTPLVLTFMVAFWVFFRGAMISSAAFEQKALKEKGWGWTLVLGFMVLISAFILFWNPQITGLTVVYVLAIAFYILGAQHIIAALRIIRLNRKLKASAK